MDNPEALEVEEEVDVMSLLDIQTEEAEEHDEEVSDETPETLEQALELLAKEREIKTKRNKSLKKSKQATHRMQEELQARDQRLDELERKLTDRPNNVEAEKHEQEVQEWQDRVADDPSQALAYADWKQSKLEDKLANYLGSTVNELKAEIQALRGDTNPEKLEYKAEIAKLKQSEQFADLDDDVLLKLAKGLKGAKIKKPRGTVGGKKAEALIPAKDYTLSDEDREKMGF